MNHRHKNARARRGGARVASHALGVPARLVSMLAFVLTAVLFLASCAGTPDPAPTPEASPSRTYPYEPRPSGLMWDSGVFGHDPKITGGFAQMRSLPLDVLGVSPTRGTWAQTFSTWWLDETTIPPGFEGTLNVSVQLFPTDGTMEAAAAGEYNEEFERLGKLIADRYPDSYVRPGWEFNIVNWPWRATPENVDVFKEAFRQASISLKKGGPDLRIVWNPNQGKGNSLPDATTAWPGDDVVDVVGIDAYDWSPPYDEKGWQEHKTKHQGWDFWGNFTREHGKEFAVPEWGVIPGSENSGGDNPKYIEYVMQWMLDNRDIMAFETYFEEPADYCQCALAMNPNARQAYLDFLPKITQPQPDGAATGAAAPVAAARREDVAALS